MEPAPRILPHLSRHDLVNPVLLQALYQNMQEDYYWSEDFSAEFYTAQARAGLIAVTEMHRGRELLLPDLHRSFAVLDFSDLHTSRKVRRILRHQNLTLDVGFSLHRVAEQITHYHRNSWLTPRYLKTLEAVNAQHNDLHVISVLLRDTREITAGEIGYILGRTYTSLSGFHTQQHPSHGTAQLVLLGRWLEQQGFAFWNLGQPYMPYKFSLGAREYSREAFLSRWLPASQQRLPIT